MLTMILAIDKNNLIGSTYSSNGLPWHYEEDLKFYKNNTVNKINLMGRKTYESIGRALPNRDTYVLTSNKQLFFKDANMLYSKGEVEELIFSQKKTQEIMVVGGVGLFCLLFEHVDKILLTRINEEHSGDIFYTDLDLSDFRLKNEKTGDDTRLSFQIWERK